MKEMSISKCSLGGDLTIPPSKSHSLRALLFAMLANGTSEIENLLPSPDIEAMTETLKLFGASVFLKGNMVRVEGNFRAASDIIDAGNSGIILRFIGAIASLLPSYTEITGDASIRRQRPIKPLLGALRSLGALAESARGDGYAPILVRGPIRPGKCRLNGEDSQPVSALLTATSFLKGPSVIEVDNPGETPWIDLTLDWLRRFGANVKHENYRVYHVEGGLSIDGFSYTVPGDYSTAAFPLAAALITKSPLTLHGLNQRDVQGDRVFLDLLSQMGAKIWWEKSSLQIEPVDSYRGIEIDVNRCIDALPILATLGCYASSPMRLYNGAIARKKESNRIEVIASELRKMGAEIHTFEDGLIVHPSPLNGALLESHSDHRIALSLAVAAMGAATPSTLVGGECIAKTYPHFARDFQQIGAALELDPVRI